MREPRSPVAWFRETLSHEKPLQVVGAIKIRADGTQKNIVDNMQTRVELHDGINYNTYRGYARSPLNPSPFVEILKQYFMANGRL